MRNVFFALTFFSLSIAAVGNDASAQQAFISYGTNNIIELQADTADQRVDFFINNISGKAYDTIEMYFRIGDGGNAGGGTDTGPRLTAVELGEPGTVFAGGLRGVLPPAQQTPLLWADFIDGVANASDGQLGTLVFDTTGITAGSGIPVQFSGIDVAGQTFETSLRGAPNIPEFLDTNSNGSITIVAAIPEPASSMVVLALGGLLAMVRRR